MARTLRSVAVGAALSLAASGCVSQTYRISQDELARLAATPPEQRGQSVRVVQDLTTADDPPEAQPVTTTTQIVIVPRVDIVVGGPPRPIGPGPRPEGPAAGGGGGRSPTFGKGDDAKAQAILYLALAASAAIVLAATEGSRYDGYVELHPMMPVHLWGPGGY